MMSKKLGRPKTVNKVITKSSQEGTLDGETRATFIINEKSLEILKAVAKKENKQIKEVIGEALELFFNSKTKIFIKKALQEYRNKENILVAVSPEQQR